MLKLIFTPQRNNAFAWQNFVILLILVFSGEVSAVSILYAYFFESIIIGFFNIAKMLYCHYYTEKKEGPIIGLILFFTFHYGFFIGVQSVFLFAIISMSGHSVISEPFHLLENYGNALESLGVYFVLLVLILGQILKFIFDFIKPRKYLEFSAYEIMFMPYLRIIIQQFVVILGSFFIVFSEASLVTALILIIMRFVLDLFFSSIRKDSEILDWTVEKLYNGKTSKTDLKKQLLLWSE
jgi:hypothetical protein